MNRPALRRAVRVTKADTTGFRCGEQKLDHYFKKYAVDNDGLGIGRTFVLHRDINDDPSLPTVLGFFTLSMADIESASASTLLGGRQLPQYEMPVARIARLAVHKRAQKKGFGELLLVSAFDQVLEGADHVGCVAVMVDAKHERAASFYSRYGFVALSPPTKWPWPMFIAMQDVRLSFAAASMPDSA